MRGMILMTLLSLSAFGNGCSSESVAAKYLADSKSGESAPAKTTPDPIKTTPDPPATEMKGDSAAGLKIIEDKSICAGCHPGVSKQVLDKSAVAKLDSAKELPIHSSLIDHFSGQDRLDIEAALNTK